MTNGRPKSGDPKRPILRSFVENPMIRIIGLLLIIAGAVVLYFNPEYHVTPRWRGGPIPTDWSTQAVAGRLSLPLPADVEESQPAEHEWRYSSETLMLTVYLDDASFPIRRDAATMDDFRATSMKIAGQPARMATWKTANGAQPYHLGVSFQGGPLTLIVAAASEEVLEASKSAVHAIAWNRPV